jgi:hypothetical protein
MNIFTFLKKINFRLSKTQEQMTANIHTGVKKLFIIEK